MRASKVADLRDYRLITNETKPVIVLPSYVLELIDPVTVNDLGEIFPNRVYRTHRHGFFNEEMAYDNLNPDDWVVTICTQFNSEEAIYHLNYDVYLSDGPVHNAIWPAWASNFDKKHPVMWRGRQYDTTEHLYQAMKAVHFPDHEEIRNSLSPAVSKKLGRKVQSYPEWDQDKFAVMMLCLQLKIDQHADVRRDLIATGNALIVEKNAHGDTIWGMIQDEYGRWHGSNLLGKAWMRHRAALSVAID